MRRTPLLSQDTYSITWGLSGPNAPGRENYGKTDVVIDSCSNLIYLWGRKVDKWIAVSKYSTVGTEIMEEVTGLRTRDHEHLIREFFGFCDRYKELLEEMSPF